MKIAVFSDSHGNISPMLYAVEACRPDMILFLGDGSEEIGEIKKQFPQIPLKAVRGNCDRDSSLPETGLVSADGVEIFMTHGHLYGVKSGFLYGLAQAACELGAALALYGHTHLARLETIGAVTLLNPGSCGDRIKPSFAEVVTDGVGGFACRIAYL